MFEEILSRIGETLQRHGLPYMLIGGQAVLLYGEPRLTRDIDITLGVDIDRLDGVLAVAQELALRPIPQDLPTFVKETMVFPAIDETTGIRVDFIFSFSPYEVQAIQRAKKIIIMGQEVLFASPEDVIIHKIFVGRPRDLEDVRTIILKNPDLHFPYIKRWLKEFDASLAGTHLLKTFLEIRNEVQPS
jgi:Nucleotidyltransferase of unknown function (DUF6036)